MSLPALLVQTVAESEEVHHNVAMETIGFGVVAFVVFLALALVTFSYRNVANRHAAKADAYAREHAGHADGAGHGH